MLSERQNRMLRQHAIERLQMSVKHAADWVDFYSTYGPMESLRQWELTLEYRRELLKIAEENADITPPSPSTA